MGMKERFSKHSKGLAQQTEPIKKRHANNLFLMIAHYLELFVSVLLIIAILTTLISMIRSLFDLAIEGGNLDHFQTFMSQLFSVVIGIEFLKMVCGYNLDSVIEVLLFTIARQMVLNHPTSFDQLLSILAIALLFLIRKFLFVRKLDSHDDTAHSEETDSPEDSTDHGDLS